MNLSAPFIKRPVATTLLTAAIALAGAVAFRVLPVSALPQIDFPTISVGASLPGASPEIMASSVATPLERQFGRIAGVNEMTSSSNLGTTSITLQFDLNRNIDGAARDVQAAINAARSYLPTNLPSNPTYRKVNPADAPILILALTSNVYDRGKLYDAASTIMQQRLSQIQGVGQVNVGGSSLPGVRVDVNPTQLNSFGLGLQDVSAMLSRQNSNSPKGQIVDGTSSADITDNDQLLKAVDYMPLVVGYHNGAAVKLSDVANVEDSTENIRAAGFVNGKPSVLIIIFRQPGANIIDTVDRVRDAIPALKASIPSAIDVRVVLDRTQTIRASVKDVERTLVISVCLVIFVVFVFLRNFRATLIPSVAVPVSLIGTFGVMYLCHYSIDNLSLMALTIATGFVVDDAIVVIENITRYIEQGMHPMQAALKGASEIGFTVLSISLSLVAVFIPILMMGGIVGRLFREFAVTLSVAILVSLLVSLTTTPMMCSRLLKHIREEDRSWAFRLSERFFQWVLGTYERTLGWVLEHSTLTLIVLGVTIGVNIYLFNIVPKGFFPQQDNGTVFGGIQGPQDTSFQAMQTAVQHIVDVIKTDPAVENVMAFTGGGGPTNSGFVFLGLKPLQERKANAGQMIDRLRPKLMAVPGANTFMQAGQDLRIGGRQSSAQYQYTIQSDNLQDLVQWGPVLLQQMRKMRILTDVNTDQQNSGLQMTLVYDRATASRLGITPQMLDTSLYQAFGQAQVSTMYTGINQYHVVLEVDPKFWQSPTSLQDVYIRSAQGTVVPLSAIASYQANTAPLSVNHQGQYPSVTISFNLVPGVALSDASRSIIEMEQRIGVPIFACHRAVSHHHCPDGRVYRPRHPL
jgi:multidrug efflux pump